LELLEAGAGAVLLGEEAVGLGEDSPLDAYLRRQPPWSDLPVLVLARTGADSAIVARAMDRLGNVTVLERPTRIAALVSAVRSALRARQRQCQLRDQFEALQESERLFRILVHSSSQSTWRYRPGDAPRQGIDAANAAWWREFTGQTE